MYYQVEEDVSTKRMTGNSWPSPYQFSSAADNAFYYILFTHEKVLTPSRTCSF